jgi:flagellar biosynthesis GTPase FlhF
LRQAQHDVQEAQAELQQTKDADAAVQDSLRSENQSLTRRLSEAQTANTKLRTDNQQLNQQLGTTRQAVQLQQQHLEQLQTDNQEPAQTMTVAEARAACIENLRQIDAAKAAWALQNGKTTADIPTEQELIPYLPDNTFPVCPSGGIYTIGAVGVAPTCSIPGHALPQ